MLACTSILHFFYKIFLYPLLFCCHFDQRSCQYTSHAAIRTYAHANKESKDPLLGCPAVIFLWSIFSIFFWRYGPILFIWSVWCCLDRRPHYSEACFRRNNIVSCSLTHAPTGLSCFILFTISIFDRSSYAKLMGFLFWVTPFHISCLIVSSYSSLPSCHIFICMYTFVAYLLSLLFLRV